MDGRKQQEKKRLRKSKKKGLRVGCGSVAASERCISCTTFNILAPIYKRLSKEDQSCRESQYKANWLNRNEKIIDQLLVDRSSIICLQEVWLGNEELVQMYEKRLGDAGYISFKLARTNNRGDGLLTAMHQDYFRIINYRELLFNDFGDRVAQLLHVESAVALWQGQTCSVQQQILIVNTHLLFPHDFSLCIVRLQQVYKILQYIETYQKSTILIPCPSYSVEIGMEANGGHVYKFLRSQGFLSSYDTVHRYSDVDAHKWVSHRNHRGNVCGVDFIWLLNPNKFRKPLTTSWNEAVFCLIKSLLRAASLTEDNAFAFLKMDNPFDYITYSSFCQALHQLGLSSHPHGLSPEDTKGLWTQADTDGNGIVDFEEFQQQIWNPKCFEKAEEETILETKGTQMIQQTFGFNVKDAILFPPEVEQGMWPENYSLSDHAPLTVVFSPVKIPGSQPVC